MSTKQQQSGFVLIDALIGVTIAGVLSIAFLSIIHQSVVASSQAREKFDASLHTLEIYEVVVALAEEDFTALAAKNCTSSNPCSVSHNGTIWDVDEDTIETVGQYERSFTLSTVNRDASGDIVETGTPDSETLRLDILVEWNSRGEDKEEALTAYVHDIEA